MKFAKSMSTAMVKKLDEPYTQHTDTVTNASRRDNMAPVTVPEGKYGRQVFRHGRQPGRIL